MTTMRENKIIQPPAHGLTKPEQYLALTDSPGTDVYPPKDNAMPLFSHQLRTVDQLMEITVDPDIQTSVADFLKGLTTQMFARIVRNGSAEVGTWLGAKIQGERDGWMAMLKMAMHEIEFNRKNALQGQVLLHATQDQLSLLVNCFQIDDDVKEQLTKVEASEGIQVCLQILSDCCNALIKERFQCLDILGYDDPEPESLSAVVQCMKEKLDELKEEKSKLEKQYLDETLDLLKEREHLFDEIQKMENQVKGKQDDLEALKTQLKEIDQLVQYRKTTTADKCVGTPADMLRLVEEPLSAPQQFSTSLSRHHDCVEATQSTTKEDMCTQTVRESSVLELSQDKLRLLKDRASKLESSLQGAINSMSKLRKGPRGCEFKRTNTFSSLPSTATFVALPIHTHFKDVSKSGKSSSFAATNGTTSSGLMVSVPKLGHFQPTERRCLAEQVTGIKPSVDLAEDKITVDSRKAGRSRVNQVSKCLRCLKLFTAMDNHKLACCFHGKGKERIEVYSDDGQLVQVKYVWRCCRQPGNNDGCCYGQHV